MTAEQVNYAAHMLIYFVHPFISIHHFHSITYQVYG